MMFTPGQPVLDLIACYPAKPREALFALRELILQVATRCPEVKNLEETLKWGEPSYLCKSGSTLRMDWKPREPDFIFIYVNCQTKLIETCKELYADQLNFVGRRAIALPLNMALPETVLSHCIELTLKYHKIKHLPLLGC
ncbi:MAG: DUF1801 domain-containing protein [Aliiglaciecola sp.]|uniref:DUF1801 domain-containing protein n=1 Tax=Aliiglaciecola sp. TaxID=1872441 RepID=UPI003296C45A